MAKKKAIKKKPAKRVKPAGLAGMVARVAHNVRRLRKGRSVPHCAMEVGISIPSWYRIEQAEGHCGSPETLDKMAAYFGVDIGELFRKPRG